MNHIVCGPPGSGKSTYVRKNARWGDLIIDTDEIYQALSGQPFYDKPEGLLDIVFRTRDFLIDEGRRAGKLNTWLIVGGAKLAKRDQFRRRLNGQVIVIETSYFECLRRIANDERRRKKAQQWGPLVKKWWDQYERCDSDTVIRE